MVLYLRAAVYWNSVVVGGVNTLTCYGIEGVFFYNPRQNVTTATTCKEH